MFLIFRDSEPVGVYDKIQDLIKDIESRMITDYCNFERSQFYNKEPFDIDAYLDLRVLICNKNEINWVQIDFELDEIYLVDYLNKDNSNVVDVIEKYNANFLISSQQD